MTAKSAEEKAQARADLRAKEKVAAKVAVDNILLQTFKGQGYSGSSYVESIVLNTLLDGRDNSYGRVQAYLVSIYHDRARVDGALQQLFEQLGRGAEVPGSGN